MNTTESSAAHEHSAPRYRDSSRQRTDESVNGYLAARREWDERYGSFITRARNWRAVAILMIILALVEALGMIAISFHSKTVPYVVAVDGLGRVEASGPASEPFIPDDRIRRTALMEWLSDVRTVTNDGVAQRKAIDRVYARLPKQSEAVELVTDFYRSDPPQKRMETETVGVDIESVLATSGETYEIEWIETVRDFQGQVKSQDHWKGAFTIAIRSSSDPQLLALNPLGIYITNAHWTRVF